MQPVVNHALATVVWTLRLSHTQALLFFKGPQDVHTGKDIDVQCETCLYAEKCCARQTGALRCEVNDSVQKFLFAA